MKESKVFGILQEKFPDYNVPYCIEVAEQIDQLYDVPTLKDVQNHFEQNCRHEDGSPMFDLQTFYEGAKWIINKLNQQS